MSLRTDFASMASMIGRAADDEELGRQMIAEIAPLLGEPEAAEEIVAGLLAEARRKRPRDATLRGYVTMLGVALDGLRLAANGGDPEAREAIPAVRDALGRGAAEGGMPPEMLLDIARAFADAQLDPGPVLQQATVDALEEAAPEHTDIDVSPRLLAAQFAELAAALDNDPFALHQMIAGTAAAFPLDRRASMIGMLAMSNEAAVREAALGFAFAAEPEMSDAAFAAVTAQASGAPVSSVLVERLARMRPWFAPRRQAAIDNALRMLRPKADAPQAQARPEIRSVITSLCDGSGAESLIAVVKRGKRFALASVLLKLGIGVADTAAQRDLSQAECEEMAGVLRKETDAIEVAIGTFERRVAAALAVNVARDAPPPFGLLDVVETIGLGPLHPEAIGPAAFAAELLADLPADKTSQDATRAAFRAVPRWRKTFAVIDTWGETGEDVDALLRPLKTRAQRVHAVLHQLLPARRGAWAERCAWAAAALKDSHESDPEAWIDFALVARALAGDAPLAEIPLAVAIAENTVEFFAER